MKSLNWGVAWTAVGVVVASLIGWKQIQLASQPNSSKIKLSETPSTMSVPEARRALHDEGTEFTRESFEQSLQNHDFRSIELFIRAGMRLTPPELEGFTRRIDSQEELILTQVDQSAACPTDTTAGRFYTKLDSEAVALVKRICSVPSVRIAIKNTLQSQNAKLQQDQEQLASLPQQAVVCKKMLLESYGIEKLSSMANDGSLDNAGTYTTPQAAAAYLRMRFLAGGWRGNEIELQAAADDACGLHRNTEGLDKASSDQRADIILLQKSLILLN